MQPEILQFFFSSESTQLIGTVVNAVIVAIASLAGLQLLRAFSRVHGSHRALDNFAQAIRGKKTPDEVQDAARTLPPNHLMARRVDILRELHSAGADIDAAALSGLAVAELDREIAGARWAASTAVLLGLAGTLIGLSQAVIKAMPLLRDITNSYQANQAIVDTFGGLGTAFSTTLMGILCAVPLGWAVGRFRAKQSAYIQRLEQVSLVHVVPYFRTSPALAMVEAARKLSDLEKSIAVALTEVIGQLKTQGLALTKIVEDSLSDVVTETRTTGRALQQSVHGALGEVVREVRERGIALTGTVDSSFATLTGELHAGTADLLHRMEAVSGALTRLLGDPGADARTLAENLAVLQKGTAAMALAAERMREMAPSIEEAIARQVDRQSRDLHETMHAYTGRLSGSVEQQSGIIENGFGRLEQGIGGFGDVLLGQLERHDRELLTQVGGSIDQVGEHVAQVEAALRGHFLHLEELRNAVAHLSEATRQLEGRGAQDREAGMQIREATDHLTRQLGELGQRLEGLHDTLARSMKAAAVAAGAPIPTAYVSGNGGSTLDGSSVPAPPLLSVPSSSGMDGKPVTAMPASPLPRVEPARNGGFFSRFFGRS